MHWVYVIQHDQTREIYIGKTDDIKRRLHKHMHGRQTATRHKSGTWHLVYAEMYRVSKDAAMRERKLKQHGSNKRWLLDRIKHSLLEG